MRTSQRVHAPAISAVVNQALTPLRYPKSSGSWYVVQDSPTSVTVRFDTAFAASADRIRAAQAALESRGYRCSFSRGWLQVFGRTKETIRKTSAGRA